MHEKFEARLRELFGALDFDERLRVSEFFDAAMPLVDDEVYRVGGMSSPHFSRIANEYCNVSATRISQYFPERAQKHGLRTASVEELVRQTFDISDDARIELSKVNARGLRLNSVIAFRNGSVSDYIRSLYAASRPVTVVRIQEQFSF